jgi:hypothetical protein
MPSDLFGSFSELLNLVSEVCLEAGKIPVSRGPSASDRPVQNKSRSRRE